MNFRAPVDVIGFEYPTRFVAYFTDLADLPFLIKKLALPHYTVFSPLVLAQAKATSGAAGGQLFPAIYDGLEML